MPHTVYGGHGFNTAAWPRRSNTTHRADADREKKAPNPTQAEAIAKETGARWSILLDLPYFDPCRMASIDPMYVARLFRHGIDITGVAVFGFCAHVVCRYTCIA